MREIFRSYRKAYLNDLSKSLTPFILVDYPLHNHTKNKYRIDESKHYVTNQYHPEHYGLYPKAGKYCGWQ